MSFQDEIVNGAEQDAWISVLLVGFSLQSIIWMMFYVLRKSDNGDIISLHQQFFGNGLGNVLNILF